MSHEPNLAQRVRASDYDRFLCIQRAAPSARPALYALTEFNAELAHIAETVSEPLVGHIKLAWWRDALLAISAGKPSPNHPLVNSLVDIHAAHPAIMPHLLSMVDARAMDLDESLMAEETGWLEYLDGTAGALHAAWAEVLNEAAAQTHAARIAREARAYAMVGLVRAIPYMQRHGFLRFPQQRLAKCGVSSLLPSDALTTMVMALLSESKNHVENTLWPKSLRPLAACSAISQLYAKKMINQGAMYFNAEPSKPAVFLILLTSH